MSHLLQSSFLGTELTHNDPQDKAKEEKKPEEEKPEEKKEAMHPAKVLESGINIMRGEMCWARHKLVGHEACMTWLVEECTDKTFGTGLCKKVRAHVKEECMQKHEKACEYAKQLGIDIPVDTDGDGVPDKEDAFPKDPAETKDTDGDGVGDNADEAPSDPKCVKKPCELPTTAAPTAAAPAPATAPAPAAELKENKAAPAPAKEAPKAPAPAKKAPKAPAPAPAKKEAKDESKPQGTYKDPVAQEGLASQGFSGKKVSHADGDTATADWGKEYGNDVDKSEPKKSSSTRAWNMHALTFVGAAALAFLERDVLLG